MGVTFTEEQQKVIDLRNRNILVSAAAGSGKTAVLVERILSRITRDDPPIDVDRLLIVTYTEAAASEMRERIRDRIEAELLNHPQDEHLQRQSTLVHHAQVSTIHGFCLSVIRDYFHTISLDPGFRIGEEGELKLLSQDVLSGVLEECYQEGEEDFLNFVESFAYGRDDRKLEEIILQLYEYSLSYPDPEGWLDENVSYYDVENKEALSDAPFVKKILEDTKTILGDLKDKLSFGVELCQEEDGPLFYEDVLCMDISSIEKAKVSGNFQEMSENIRAISWERLSSKKGKEESPDKRALVQKIRKECKGDIEKLQKEYFYDSLENILRDLALAKKNMEVLVRLVKAYGRAFRAKKQSKIIIDFHDMEYYALQILTCREEGELVPSPVAREYQEQFCEIMIDEYQDSNYLQEAILTSVSTVSQGKNNIFMVGDVKQSIYRFRLSRPELFMKKYETYSEEDGPEQKIDLHKNFRSRREVLESTNFLFEQMMCQEFGGICYDDKAALYAGAVYEEKPDNETEVCFVDTLEIPKEECSQRELEARALAREIKSLVGTKEVFDKRTGSYRRASYRDIVILVRTLKGWVDVFVPVLMEEGIPAYSASKEGYFETREIQMLLDYLRILDNPRQDIPFVAVLASPFAGLSSQELAYIRTHGQGRTFYEKTMDYVSGSGELFVERESVREPARTLLPEKLRKFLDQYETFRKKVPYTAIHTLLLEIMEATGYRNYVCALPAGEQRSANLEMLVEKAVSFESTSYKGLFHFVRYIEELHKYEVDYGEADVMEESADVVRIMSIHKSKGLEFPIVFVAGMNKKFNIQDAQGSIVIHPELGVGLDAVDLQERTKAPTLLKRMIQREVRMESVAEELRVLYVAMTRAKEKLILIGTNENLEGQIWGSARLSHYEKTVLPYSLLAGAGRYFDWVVAALYRNRIFAEVLNRLDRHEPILLSCYNKPVPIRVRWIKPEELTCSKIEDTYREALTEEILNRWDTKKVYDPQVKRQIEEQFAYRYPYEEMANAKQKKSVSELKKKAYILEDEMEEEEVVVPLYPKFLQKEEKLTGAGRGTAYHRVLELLDMRKQYDVRTLKSAIEEMKDRGLLTLEMASVIRDEDLLFFLGTSVGERIQKAAVAGKLRKEQPFVLAEEDAGQKEEGDVCLIQGIIDLYFEEDGALVVVDYKTDRVQTCEELTDRYRVQLDYYGKALEQITGKPVKEKIIYSFALGREISLSASGE